MSQILAVSPSNVFDRLKLKYLLDSAEINKININIIGLDKPFTFLSKIALLQEYMLSLESISNPIICFTDAYDVFYLDNLETIKTKFLSFQTNILWSVEKIYSHQLKIDKEFYENLTLNSTTLYKYINTGTFIGYKNSLLELFNDIMLSIQDATFLADLANEGWGLKSLAVDQTIISHHLALYWNKYNITLDTRCNVFYIPCQDWDNITDYINNRTLLVTASGQKPSIIHVPYKLKYEYLLNYLFDNYLQFLKIKHRTPWIPSRRIR